MWGSLTGEKKNAGLGPRCCIKRKEGFARFSVLSFSFKTIYRLLSQVLRFAPTAVVDDLAYVKHPSPYTRKRWAARRWTAADFGCKALGLSSKYGKLKIPNLHPSARTLQSFPRCSCPRLGVAEASLRSNLRKPWPYPRIDVAQSENILCEARRWNPWDGTSAEQHGGGAEEYNVLEDAAFEN